MDNNNRSKIFPKDSPKKFSDKRMFLQYKNNIDKKKSEDINSINFKSPINNQSKKNLLNLRSTYQGKIILSNIINNNNEQNINLSKKDINNTNREKPIKKDKNYFLNLLDDIYFNETHLSNKNAKRKNMNNNSNNIIKGNKNFIKKQTYNFSKLRGSSKNLIRKSYKSSKKILSTFSNEKINKSNRLSNNGSKDNIEKSIRSNKKQSTFSKNIVNKKPIAKFLSERFVSKFKANEEQSKVKVKESVFKIIKSSQNVINEVEYMNETLKDEKKENNINKVKNVNNENNETMIKEVKPIKPAININENQMKNSKKSRNVENENFTKMDSNKSIPNNKSIKVKKVKKMYKTCFFCCLFKNDDSLSENN